MQHINTVIQIKQVISWTYIIRIIYKQTNLIYKVLFSKILGEYINSIKDFSLVKAMELTNIYR